MRALPAILLICLISPFSAHATGPSNEQIVQSVFSELRLLKPMQAGQQYTVQVAERTETGLKEQFLRRRTAREIRDSGLSCGCGDYALLFIERIEPLGFKSLLVDGAEISSASLQTHFSGHAVVAIRGREAASDSPWWLVDSTNLRILSRNWSPAETSFQAFGHIFWIGYCGPLSGYPVHGADELKAFYTRTLAAVPPEFYNRTLCRIEFSVAPSFVGHDTKFLNPWLADFLQMQAGIFTAYHIEPQRVVSVLLVPGDDSTSSNLKYTKAGGWIGQVGLQSSCSPSLLAYFEQTIRNQEQHAAQSSGD